MLKDKIKKKTKNITQISLGLLVKLVTRVMRL
jgi:hypothetical protein